MPRAAAALPTAGSIGRPNPPDLPFRLVLPRGRGVWRGKKKVVGSGVVSAVLCQKAKTGVINRQKITGQFDWTYVKADELIKADEYLL